MDPPTGVALVALGASATALATGLGALPFVGRHPLGDELRAAANGVAAGVMVAASLGLLIEGSTWSLADTGIGVVAGVIFVALVTRLVADHPVRHFAGVSGAGAGRAVVIVLVMTAHSAAEGIGVGVAYGGGEALGLTTTIAIALHNIPEGLAIALVMIPRGASVASAAAWAVISSLPQPLLAVPAFLLVDWSVAVLPIGLGFAAGAMVWMALVELIPDAVRESGASRVWPAALGAFVILGLLQLAVAA